MRLAVVGHVEWCEFVRVERLPAPGEVVHALETWTEPGGGGAVAAAQLARLAGGATLFTVLGAGEGGRRSRELLESLGVVVRASKTPGPQRRAIVFVDEEGERTITVFGPKQAPRPADGDLPWEELAGADGALFVSGDAAALRAARRARVLVASARELPVLQEAELEVDALVGSSTDPAEPIAQATLEPPPRLIVATAGPLGGWSRPGGPFRAPPLPGPFVDAYGAGDCFAAGLTFALADGREPADALAFAARCGAAVLTGRGPYEAQLAL